MAFDLPYRARTDEDDRKFSLASVSSTCEGDSQSTHSSDENMMSDTKKGIFLQDLVSTWPAHDGNCINTVGLQTFTRVGEDDLDSPFWVGSRDGIPSTREPSPEPLWHRTNHWNLTPEIFSEQTDLYAAHCDWNEEHVARQNQDLGRHLPRKSSREPPMQRGDEKPPAQPYPMMFVVPKPVFVPTLDANAMLLMNHCEGLPFPTKNTPAPSAAQMPSGKPAQDSAGSGKDKISGHSKEEKLPQVSEKKEQTASANSKQNGKAKSRGEVKGEAVFDKLSDDQKTELCKYIYDFMLEKKLTSPEGYLIVDVFSEVWKGMDDSAQSWKVAQHRFNDLLRFAPQYFRLFRKSIKIANHCGWYARKGQQMVSLVREAEGK